MKRSLFVLVLLSLVVGCGEPPMVTVKGTIKFNGKPVKACKLAFFPDVAEFNPDRHGYGYAMSGENGVYEVQHPKGEKGIYPGRYKVTFVLWVDSKGNVLPPEIKPSEVEGGVKNMFPTKYENLDETPEIVDVPGGGLEKDFDIAG